MDSAEKEKLVALKSLTYEALLKFQTLAAEMKINKASGETIAKLEEKSIEEIEKNLVEVIKQLRDLSKN